MGHPSRGHPSHSGGCEWHLRSYIYTAHARAGAPGVLHLAAPPRPRHLSHGPPQELWASLTCRPSVHFALRTAHDSLLPSQLLSQSIGRALSLPCSKLFTGSPPHSKQKPESPQRPPGPTCSQSPLPPAFRRHVHWHCHPLSLWSSHFIRTTFKREPAKKAFPDPHRVPGKLAPLKSPSSHPVFSSTPILLLGAVCGFACQIVCFPHRARLREGRGFVPAAAAEFSAPGTS